MKIKDLIALLQEQNPEAEVGVNQGRLEDSYLTAVTGVTPMEPDWAAVPMVIIDFEPNTTYGENDEGKTDPSLPLESTE